MSEKLPSVSGKVLLTIPDHNPVAKDTLADIPGKVSIWCQIDKQEIITKLRSW